jgi:tetratricopeptide (TPR) repeat protein
VRAELAAARQLQAQGDLDAALEAAQRALELVPAHREARHLRVRLASARLERQLDSRIQAMLGEAQRLEAGGKLQAAAKKLREAAALDAGSSAVHSRLAAVEAELARQGEARRRAGELAVAEAAIAALLQRGELDDAQRLLDQSLAELGETDSLSVLRVHLDELWQRRESAPAEAPSGEGLAEIWEAAETIAQLIARRDTDAALKELHNAELRCGHRAELDGLRRRLAELVLADDSPSD